jgi:hypothetical protein
MSLDDVVSFVLLFFIGQYVLACVLLPATVVSVVAKSDRVSEYLFRGQTVASI